MYSISVPEDRKKVMSSKFFSEKVLYIVFLEEEEEDGVRGLLNFGPFFPLFFSHFHFRIIGWTCKAS